MEKRKREEDRKWPRKERPERKREDGEQECHEREELKKRERPERGRVGEGSVWPSSKSEKVKYQRWSLIREDRDHGRGLEENMRKEGKGKKVKEQRE